MMAPKLRFSRGLKANAPGAVRCLLCSLLGRRRSSKFLQAHPVSQEAAMVKVRIFIYLWGSFKCMIVILPTIWRSAPALKFTVSWNIEVFARSNSASSVVIFFHQAPPVTSFLSQPISTAIPTALTFKHDETTSLLDRRRHESHQTYSSYQLVSHLGTSTTLFPAVWTKTGRWIENLFSQRTRPKRASSDQRTDEEDTSETCNNNHVGGRALTNG